MLTIYCSTSAGIPVSLMTLQVNWSKREAYSEHCKTSKMKLFAKRVNSWTFFAKGSILRRLTGFWICLCKQQTKSLNSYKSFFPGVGLSNYIIRDCIHALYEFTQINSLLFPLKIRENLKQIKNRSNLDISPWLSKTNRLGQTIFVLKRIPWKIWVQFFSHQD